MPRLPSALLACVLVPSLLAADWPQWRGPTRDGRWPEKGLPARLPEKLPARWKVPLGGGYGGIAVVAGSVYVMDRVKEPKEAERVVCLDAASGKVVWTHSYAVAYGKLDYGNGPRSTPTVHTGKVYTFGALGHLRCLDAKTGKVVWGRDAVKDFRGKVPTWGHSCSPLVEGKSLIVQVGGTPDAGLVALDLDTGKEMWLASSDRPGYASAVVVEVAKRRQLVYFTPQHVVGLDPTTGKRLWRVPFEGIEYDVSITDVVSADGVLLASNYWSGSKAIRLDAEGKNPKVVWEGKALSLLMSTPLVRGKHFYALDRFKGLKCVEASSGKILWENEHITPRGSNPQASLVWIDETLALILNARGELLMVGLTPKGLTRLGKVSIVGKTWAHPAFADRCVFARSDTQIVCVPLAGE